MPLKKNVPVDKEYTVGEGWLVVEPGNKVKLLKLIFPFSTTHEANN
jgi:hypothetical protein